MGLGKHRRDHLKMNLKTFFNNLALNTPLHEQMDVALNSAGAAGYIIMGITVLQDRELALVAQGTRGLAIMDISDVSATVQLGAFISRTAVPTWHPVRAADVIGNNCAFVTRSGGVGTIELIDITNPAIPVSLDDDVNVAANYSDIKAYGDFFYVAGQVAGVFKYSNTNPLVLTASNTAGSWETQGVEVGLLGGVEYCIFSNYGFGLRIVDAATMGGSLDVSLAAFIPSFSPRAIRPWKGKLAHIGGKSYFFCVGNTSGDVIDALGLLIADVTDPSAPFWLTPIEATGLSYDWTALDGGDKPVLGITLYNDQYAFVSFSTSGIACFDIRVPERCRYLGVLDNMDTYTGSGGTEKDSCAQLDVFEQGDQLYLVSGDGAHTPDTEGSDQVYVDKVFL